MNEPDLPLLSSAANRTDSSVAGAKAIAPVRERQYERVLGVLRARGDYGATNEEVQKALPELEKNCQTRAMNDLVRLGLARDSLRRRKSSHGVHVIVWVAT